MLISGRGYGSLFMLGTDNKTMNPVPFVRRGRPEKPPLLFIHGIEFSSPEESLRDLVWPMIEALGPQRVMGRSIYIFVWNSLLTNDLALDRLLDGSLMERLKIVLRELPKSRTYLRDVERRAKEAAHHLCPFVTEWSVENQMGPTVITHSMGSLVWAETLRLLLESSQNVFRPGIWWSLQPAMHRRAFAHDGEYSAIPKLYTGAESAKALIWYSRLDYVLGSFYLFSKRGFALGQYGCPVGTLPQRDVTSWAKEAHGMKYLRPGWGHFFDRLKPILTQEADSLGI